MYFKHLFKLSNLIKTIQNVIQKTYCLKTVSKIVSAELSFKNYFKNSFQTGFKIVKRKFCQNDGQPYIAGSTTLYCWMDNPILLDG